MSATIGNDANAISSVYSSRGTSIHRNQEDGMRDAAAPRQPEDSVTLSDFAKAVGRAPHEYLVGKFSKVSVSSYKETFADYDNSAAVAKRKEYIDTLSLIPELNKTAGTLDESSFVSMGDAGLELRELTQEEQRAVVSRKSRAMAQEDFDSWLRGEAAFSLDMLDGVSATHFVLFVPEEDVKTLIDEAKKVFGTGTLLGNPPTTEQEEDRAKELLKQLSELTPTDFEWLDSSGLQALTLEERDEFQSSMGTLLQEMNLDIDAKSLRFDFSVSGDLTELHGGSLSEENVESVKNMFNQYSGISEASKVIVDRLRELARKNSEVFWGEPLAQR